MSTQALRVRPQWQTQFGNDKAPPHEMGNCYPACLASLLGLPLGAVPHFYAMHNELELAWAAVVDWLKGRGYSVLHWQWAGIREQLAAYRFLLGDSTVLVSGKSPRGDFQHAVLGRLTADGWELVHDPHPDGTGIEGEPTSIEVLIVLVLPPEGSS